MKIIDTRLLKMVCVAAVMCMQLNAQKPLLSETNEEKYALEHLDILNDEVKVLQSCIKDRDDIGKTLKTWNIMHEKRILENREKMPIEVKKYINKVTTDLTDQFASYKSKKLGKGMSFLCKEKKIYLDDMTRYIFTKYMLLKATVKTYKLFYNLQSTEIPTEIRDFIEEYSNAFLKYVFVSELRDTRVPTIETFYTCKEMAQFLNVFKLRWEEYYCNVKKEFDKRSDSSLKPGEAMEYYIQLEDEALEIVNVLYFLFGKTPRVPYVEKHKSILRKLFCYPFGKPEKKEENLSERANESVVRLLSSASRAQADGIKEGFVIPKTTTDLLKELRNYIDTSVSALENQIKKAYKVDTLPSLN